MGFWSIFSFLSEALPPKMAGADEILEPDLDLGFTGGQSESEEDSSEGTEPVPKHC